MQQSPWEANIPSATEDLASFCCSRIFFVRCICWYSCAVYWRIFIYCYRHDRRLGERSRYDDWTVRGLNPGGGQIFHAYQTGPEALPGGGGGKVDVAWCWPPSPSSAWLRIGRNYATVSFLCLHGNIRVRHLPVWTPETDEIWSRRCTVLGMLSHCSEIVGSKRAVLGHVIMGLLSLYIVSRLKMNGDMPSVCRTSSWRSEGQFCFRPSSRHIELYHFLQES
jgi:hypothetical protein